jgi:hypothetical protein
MFIETLFAIDKLRKQSGCLTTDECIKEMWFLYAIVLHSATQKKEILSFEGK